MVRPKCPFDSYSLISGSLFQSEFCLVPSPKIYAPKNKKGETNRDYDEEKKYGPDGFFLVELWCQALLVESDNINYAPNKSDWVQRGYPHNEHN